MQLIIRSHIHIDKKLLVTVFAAMVLTACGGGGSNGVATDATSVTPATPQVIAKMLSHSPL
jgi:urease alpha subunit